MTIENVLSFVYVYRYRSFHKAADALYVTQPSLTSRIQTLEKELNTTLLIRSRSGVTLTEEGKTFLPYALQIINSYTQARQALSRGEHSIIIGTNISVSITILPHVVRVFHQLHAHTPIEIITGIPDELFKLLMDKQCDFLITELYGRPEVEETPVYRDPISLVAPPDHPFAMRTIPPDFKEVALEPIIRISTMENYWEAIMAHFKKCGVKPNIMLNVNSVEVAKNMVLQGIGLTFVPELAIENELMNKALSIIRPVPELHVERNLSLIHRKDDIPPYRDLFVDLCRRYESDSLS